MKYRKKPVVIDAIRWTGHEGEAGVDNFFTPEEHRSKIEIDYSCRGEDEGLEHGIDCDCMEDDPLPLLVHTLEGVMTAEPGDWIIRGTHGELYPIKAHIFEANYEAVEEVVV